MWPDTHFLLLVHFLKKHSLFIIIRLFLQHHEPLSSARHCSLPPQYIIQNKTVLLASEYANPTFDDRNQLMYEQLRVCVCVAARQATVCVSLMQSSTPAADRTFSQERWEMGQEKATGGFAGGSTFKGQMYVAEDATGEDLCPWKTRTNLECLCVHDDKCPGV